MAGTVHGSPGCLWSSLDHLAVIDATPTTGMGADEFVSEIIVRVDVG